MDGDATGNDIIDASAEEEIRNALSLAKESRGWRIFKRLLMAAMGSIPWVGGFIAAAASIREEEQGQLKINELHRQWLEEHSEKMARLAQTLTQLVQRLSDFGTEIEERIQSEEYLILVRKAFRSWDKADTEEKRRLVRNLIGNAAATKICDDDLVRLFLDWIDRYHESHFRVIRCIHQNPGATRAFIWGEIHGREAREDSAEADLFKLLILDLSTGHVIRQRRETNSYGEFLKKPRSATQRGSRVMKSAFDDQEPYVLTELGREFVHYTMNEIVPRINGQSVSPG
jgi:hypothetical protein